MESSPVFHPTTLTVHLQQVWGACVSTGLVGGNTRIYPVVVYHHWSEVQRVVFSIVGHQSFICAHVEVYAIFYPVDRIVRPGDLAGEGEVLMVYGH